MNILVRLAALERALVAAGWVPLSTFWLATFERFVTAHVRQLVARVGRRGGKSSSLCRFAVAFALAYDVKLIPPGDVGVVAFISARQDDAKQRLRTIKAILDVLRVKWKPIDDGVELVGRPIVFKVFPASVAGVSGFTGILVIADEVAKWKDADSGANPATDVLASVRPTMATQPMARMVLSSSPLGLEDAHAKAFDAGETDHQVTAFAETWNANPTITEQQTRDDEPDDRVWRREYAAIPQAGELSAFDTDAVDRAFAHARPLGLRQRAHFIIDPSSGRKDSFAYAVARWVLPASHDTWKPYLSFDLVDAVEGKFWDHTSGAAVVDRLAACAREWGAVEVHADQREALMLRAAFQERRLTYHVHDWTAQSKPIAVERVRRWFAEGIVALPTHDKLRRELLAFEERISPTGQFTFGARGSGHDDFVALLITAAMAEIGRSFAHEEPDTSLLVANSARHGGGVYEARDGRRVRLR